MIWLFSPATDIDFLSSSGLIPAIIPHSFLVNVVTKNKDELLPPYLMYIQTSNYVSEDKIKEIIKKEMIDCDYYIL